MTVLVRAVRLSQDVQAVKAVLAHDRGSTGLWESPGETVRRWLFTLGRSRRDPSPSRAEEGRGTKYPTGGR